MGSSFVAGTPLADTVIGKTTLLRDLVVVAVVEQALAMAEPDEQVEAFTLSRQKMSGATSRPDILHEHQPQRHADDEDDLSADGVETWGARGRIRDRQEQPP
jgi:hypothetical protein